MNKYGIVFVMTFLLLPTAMAAPLIYIPTGNSNNIVIIDLQTDRVVGNIDELENAHGLSGSPGSKYLVAGSMKPLESPESSSVNRPAAVNDAEHASHHPGASNDDSMLSINKSYLSIVDPEHGQVIRRIAMRGLTHHTAVSPNGKSAVAVHSGAGGISVVDLDKMVVAKSINTGPWPNYALFNKDGNRLYISNAGANTISEIDTKNWQVVREFNTGKEPGHMVLGLLDRVLYIANKGDASISAIDITSGKIKQSYLVGEQPHGIDLSSDGRWLFVASKKAGQITRIDLANDKRRTVELEPAPYHLAYIKNFNKLYVSSRKEALIWVLDPVTLTVKNTIELVQGVAHQMVIRAE